VEIVLKFRHLEIGHVQPQLLQSGQQIQLGGGVAAGQDQVGLSGGQLLQIDLLHAAQFDHVLAQIQVKAGPGVVCRGHQRVSPTG